MLTVDSIKIPCLFYSPVIPGKIVELSVVVTYRNPNDPLIHVDLERFLAGATSLLVFYNIVEYLIKSRFVFANQVQFSLDPDTISYCDCNNVLIDGASFGFPLLVAIYLLWLKCNWPTGYYASGELNFTRRQIVSIGAASLKGAYVVQNQSEPQKIFLPQSNVRMLQRSNKWRNTPVIPLPRFINDGVNLFMQITKGVAV